MTARSLLAAAGSLLVLTTAWPANAQNQSKPQWPMERIQGFHVVLVVGETQPGSAAPSEDLPAGARKALADMAEFLPYKHYRVLDAQWSSCCSGATSRISGRLQGVMGIPGQGDEVRVVQRPYAFAVSASSSAHGIQTRFVLSADDGGGQGQGRASSQAAAETAELARRRADLEADLKTLSLEIRETQKQVEVGTARELDLRLLRDRFGKLERELEALRQVGTHGGPVAARPIIDSSFTMDAGETVVVGTSRLGGDKALIAIVTAVRKK
jgi:hypothetical protein